MTHITGHRGARNLWPENSLLGFRNVSDLDVEAVEFDVHLSDAGELIVIHDATLERTTEGTGEVRHLSPAQRGETRLKGCDETIPTLDEVLAILAPSAKGLHIEIKSDAENRPYPGIVEKVVAAIDAHALRERCYLTSFDVTVLENCREVAPDIARLVSVNAAWAERQGGLEAFLGRANDLASIVAVHRELLEAQMALVTSAWSLERLCVWTLNDEALIQRWLDRRIGHLTTDSPDLALRLRAASGHAA
jgi:glycerophosphoryl diester phosphodiesterase